MDDSLQDFQSTTLRSRRIISLSRRNKKQVNPKSCIVDSRENGKTDVEKFKKNSNDTAAEYSDDQLCEPNDTLYGLEELEDDNKTNSITPKLEKVSNSTEKLSQKNILRSFKDQNENHYKDEISQEESSRGGYCSICKSVVSKKDCAAHYTKCLAKNFSSKQDKKLQMFNTKLCPTCGLDIELSTYSSHCELCIKENLEAAKIISSETVTSSYFKHTKSMNTENTHKNEQFNCPSCSKNLTLFNPLSRSNHINKCLDNTSSISNINTRMQASSTTSTTTNYATSSVASNGHLCNQCGRTMKSAVGLRRHLRTCQGENRTTKQRRRKIPVPKNADDDLLQLAKGLSVSDQETEKRKKKEEKRRKKEIPIPVMLESSQSSRQDALQLRLNAMVSDDFTIPSTPALPSSSKFNPIVIVTDCQNNKDDASEKQLDSSSDCLGLSSKVKNVEITPKVLEAKDQPRHQSVSKWGLSTAQNNEEVSFRVHGLLTQFEQTDQSPKSIKFSNAAKMTPEESMISQPNPFNEEQSQALDSTLNQLINLNKIEPRGNTEETLDSNLLEESRFTIKNKERQSVDLSSSGITTNSPSTKSTFSASPTCREDKSEVQKLQNDISKLYNNPTYSDLTLIFDDKPIYLHKCMLFCRCPTLLKILLNTCDKDSCCRVTCCSSEEILPLIHYIYTGEQRNDDKISEAALKFGLNADLGEHSSHEVHEHAGADACVEETSQDKSFDCDTSNTNHNNTLNMSNNFESNNDSCCNKKVNSDKYSELEEPLSPVLFSEDDLFSSYSPDLTQKSILRYSPVFDDDVTVENVSSNNGLSGCKNLKDAHSSRNINLSRDHSRSDSDLHFSKNEAEVDKVSSKEGSEQAVTEETSVLSSDTENEIKNASVNDCVFSDDKSLGLTPGCSDAKVASTWAEVPDVESCKRKACSSTPPLCSKKKLMRMDETTPKYFNLIKTGDEVEASVKDDIFCEKVPTIDPPSVTDPQKHDDSKQNDFQLVPESHCNETVADKSNPLQLDHLALNVSSNTDPCNTTNHANEMGNNLAFVSLTQPNISRTSFEEDNDDLFESFTQPPPVKYKFHKRKSFPLPVDFSDTSVVSEDHASSMNDSAFIKGALKLMNQCENGKTNPKQFKTPKSTAQCCSRPPLAPITPMPNFSDFDTPEIIKQAKKIGLKKTLGKRKLKVKLREVHAYTHQVESASSNEDDENDDRNTDVHASVSIQSTSTATTRLNNEVQNQQRRLVLDSSDESEDERSKAIQRAREERKEIAKKERIASDKLERLSNEEFGSIIRETLERLHKNNLIVKELTNEKNEMKGIRRGSKLDLGTWMNRFTTTSKSYKPEWSIIFNLSQAKIEAMTDALSAFTLKKSELKPFKDFFPSVMPMVYRAMLRIHKHLDPENS